jgi:L-threonylcarbamoyladenylate synthase
MKTLILKINSKNPEIDRIATAGKIIKKGGLVAFPTETVYGLGANALDVTAVRKIFEAKGRPNDNPLIVHIANKGDLNKLARDIPEIANRLISKFWPGPLTLVLKKNKIVPDEVTAGLDTVAIRMPNKGIALALIGESGPIAAPSANLSGKPSGTSINHVIHDFNGKIDCIIDGGDADIGLESTVLDLTSNPIAILRPGKITFEQLRKIIPNLIVSSSVKGEVRSPGMKYKHYSPRAKVIIANSIGDIDKIRKINEGRKIKVIDISDNDLLAKRLFTFFREADDENCDIVIVKAVEEKGFGRAIMNRLRKASSKD